MNRFHFSTLLFIGMLATSLAFLACQKDPVKVLQNVAPGTNVAADRAPNQIIYGVTLYDGTTPCEIVAIDEGSGNVIPPNVTAFYVDPNGITIPLDNLKGICLTDFGQYFLTTGTPANPTLGTTSIYNNALFKVDPVTGQCSYASTSPLGTVSDLEYDPISKNFYGLRANSNAIVEISDPGSNYSVYNAWAVTGIDPGYVLKGLSLVYDGIEYYFLGCATNNNANDDAKLYKIEITTGIASWWADLDPASELGAGHCAIGFDIDLQRVLVNRSDVAAPFLGLNIFGWPPTTPVTNSFFYGAQDYNFEDLTSSVY